MSSQKPAVVAKRDAGYFDQWYAVMTTSPVRDAIVARALGLPPELQSTSLLTWQGIAEMTEELRMPQDGLLLDLACGRGGYGIEVARRTGARLLGVDFSSVALGGWCFSRVADPADVVAWDNDNDGFVVCLGGSR